MAQGLFPYKLYVLILYGAFGLTCLALAGTTGRTVVPDRRGRTIVVNLGVATIASTAVLLLVAEVVRAHLLVAEAGAIAALVFVVSVGRQASAKLVVAGIATAVVVLSLVWWDAAPPGGTTVALCAFGLVCSALGHALDRSDDRSGRYVVVTVAVFALAGLALMVDLRTFVTNRLARETLAHHWGAFTGPALHLKAGLVPLYDVPMQYGLGPTLAIAASCDGSDCWRGMQMLVTGANLVNGLLVLAMACAVAVRRGPAVQVAVGTVAFAAVFLWPGFPADGNMLMGTPAVAGIRFLPLTLVGCLLFFGHDRGAIAAMVPALLWSPESGAMSVVVFGLVGTMRRGVLRTAALVLGLVAGSYGGLVLVHRLVYGLWIDPLALVEYVLHVPGALPIDPFSDILLLAAALGLGGWLVYKAPRDQQAARRDLVATALLFAAASYCLGRSHPNNVCNLAPYLALVATRALDRDGDGFGMVRRASGFGLAVSVAALTLSPWASAPFLLPATTDIQGVVAAVPSLEPDVQRLRAQIGDTGHLGIADFGPLRVRAPSETIVWTPMDPSSLWGYVPSERRQVYIARAARRLGRSGWAIAADDQFFLFDDLKSAYRISNERSFVGAPVAPGRPPLRYRVACFDPKPKLVSTIVGARCPVEDAQASGAAP